MRTLVTDLTVSMSDFKRNPAKVLREAGTQPVAVLNHNKAAFYILEPTMFEALIEDWADAHIKSLVKVRQAQHDQAIEVDVDGI